MPIRMWNSSKGDNAPGVQFRLARACLLCILFLFVLLAMSPWSMASSGTNEADSESIESPSVLDLQAASLRVQGLEYSLEEQQWLALHPQIRVSNEFDWPPFDFVVAGKPQGYGIDLMELLAERSGLRFEYVNGYTWDELMDMFFLGEIDLVHSISMTPERQEKASFSPPYYHSKNVLILRKDTDSTNDLSQLEGKIIAIPRGWSSIQFFRSNYPKVHIIEVDNSRQALEYVDQGKVYATVEQESIALYFIKKFGFHDLKLSSWIDNDELQKTSSMHFVVLKDQPILFSILTKALETIQPADMDQLEQKWFGREGRQIGSDDVGLTPAEKAYLEQQTTISYCLSGERMPLGGYRDGQVTGMTADFLDIFSERLGVSFALVPTTSWNESQTRLQDGDCDFLPMVNATPERKKNFDFTSSYLNYSVAIISREKAAFISGLHDFSGKQVGIPDGEATWESVLRDYPEVSLVGFSEVEECLLALSSGKIDAALISLPVATYHIRHMGLDNLKVAGHSGLQDILRIGVRKDEAQLHSIMSKLIRSLPRNDIDSVYRRWVSLTFEHRVNYSLLWKILTVIGLLLIVIMLWNRQLVKLNRRLALAHLELEKKSEELELISITDSLTELFNRRHIDCVLDAEVKRQFRYQRHLAVILIDLDNFKQVNDRFGHQTGDMVLVRFAQLLKTEIRGSDVAGRWGGEEFLVICPENNLEGAVSLAENLRRKLAKLTFADLGRQTASFGVAALRFGDSKDGLLKRADEALYLAKENGRDRVEGVS